MSVLVVGLSHHTCPAELRERLHFADDGCHAALTALKKRLGHETACIIVSTCNRVELYVSNEAPKETLEQEVRAFLSEYHEVPLADFAHALYTYADEACVSHLFRVASSLDSLVVGEGQILGQLHDAYTVAQAAQTTDKLMSGLFQRAFSTAKRVQTETGITEGKISIGSIAVDLAVSIFSNLSDKTVLIVGSGEMGQLTLKSLIAQGVGKIMLSNRSTDKAQRLAEEYRGEAVDFEYLREHLYRADIVISCTGAREPILHKGDFQHALRKRGKTPMFVIDIAVPADIAREVNDLDDVYLYGIDDLQAVTEANQAKRREATVAANALIERGVENFCHWKHSLVAESTIVSMTEELNAIRERELQKTLKHLPELTDKQREEIEYLTKRIVNNILQRPMKQLKHEVADTEAPHAVLHLVKRLFGIEETP